MMHETAFAEEDLRQQLLTIQRVKREVRDACARIASEHGRDDIADAICAMELK